MGSSPAGWENHHVRARVTTVAATLGTAGPLAYLALTVVLGLLEPGYDVLRDTQSELGAVDAAHPTAMNVGGFMGLGVSLLGVSVAYVLVLRGCWATWVAGGLVAVAGVGMVVVGFFPCDSGCVDATLTGRLHGILSAPGAIALSGAAVLSARVLALDGRFGRSWSWASFVIGLLALCSGPLVALELLGDANGLLQRAGMWPPLLWAAALSWRLLVLTRRGATPGSRTSSG
jgi:hypothetical membrane protein